jgi:iron complex transport system substrate-binding protein
MGRGNRSDDAVWLVGVTRVRIAGIFQLLITLALAACADGDDSSRDNQSTTSLKTPVSRVVTLSPHLAELVFAVGAGDLLVGVSAYTDFPPAAAGKPLIGDAFLVDQEQLAVVRPDVLLAWESGTPTHVVDKLRGLGYRVDVVRTRGLDDIAMALRQVGEITGRGREANVAASNFRQSLSQLAAQHSGLQPVRVFYQVSRQPLYTVNGEHFVSELIEVCGGQNIFSDLDGLAPLVGVEAVLDRNPEVMMAAGDTGDAAFEDWQRWDTLAANRYRNYFYLSAAEIGRPTPRLLQAGEAICALLDKVRRRRGKSQVG